MLRLAATSLKRIFTFTSENTLAASTVLLTLSLEPRLHGRREEQNFNGKDHHWIHYTSGTASSPSLSMWRQKKEMSKEGMVIVKELKRLKSDPIRFDKFMQSHVSRLLKSDLVAVLAEFQRQDQVFLYQIGFGEDPLIYTILQCITLFLAMLRLAATSLKRIFTFTSENTLASSTVLLTLSLEPRLHGRRAKQNFNGKEHHWIHYTSGTASSPSLSMWRQKKEMSKEGMVIVKELKRLKSDPIRFDKFMQSHVSRLLKSDLVAVLAEFQRQDQVFLCMKIYDVVRQEIWYRPDMFFYRDMLMMLARNKKVDEIHKVREDLRREEVLFDQHTYGNIVRSFLDGGLPLEAMDMYEEMRRSPDPPISLPYRVILKGLLPHPELREQVKDNFLELFPDMIVYDPPEDLFDDQKLISGSDDE